MKRSIIILILSLALANLTGTAMAQTTPRSSAPNQTAPAQPLHINAPAELRHLLDVDAMARKKGDSISRLKIALRLGTLFNNSGDALLSIAHAYSTLKDSANALASLTQYARLGLGGKAICNGEDKKFTWLYSNPGFNNVCHLIEANNAPVSRATQAVQIPDTGYVAEDLAYDEQDKSFLFTSVLKHAIFRLTAEGTTRPFAGSPNGWPVMALKLDRSKDLLWATEMAIPGFDGLPDSATGHSAVLAFDLRTGKLVHRYPAPDSAQWGDMVLDAQGNPIVCDGQSGAIFRLQKERWQQIDKGDFIAPQTPALTADGENLIVPDYERGLALLNIATGAVTWLNFDPGHPCALSGVDGVYLRDDLLLITQNGVEPERVVQLKLDKTYKHVIGCAVIERSIPELGEPTHGIIVGKDFYFIANSGWDTLDRHGKLKPGSRMTKPTIMRFPL